MWDLLSLVLLSADMITIPMLAFEDDAHPERVDTFTQAIRVATALFWSFDIVVSFLTGFYNGGVLEMEPAKVARHYLKTWFAFDLSIVSLDWSIVIIKVTINDVVGAARVAKMLRISRVMHAFRLLRTVKFPARVDILSVWLRSEATSTYLGVARSVLIITVASHFVACAWYSVGGLVRPLSWVQVLDDEGRGLAYRYTTSLHWSVTQFTPASMEVMPRNTLERVFAIVVILLALVAFSCFVSSITQAMANLQRKQMEQYTQDDNMRRYITENGISLELGHRITRFAKAQHVTSRLRVHEKDVQIFKCLPPSLTLELHVEVFMPILCQHPLLQRSLKIDSTFVHEVCNEAMNEMCLKPTEELFHPDQDASSAHFIQSGTWAYHRRHRVWRSSSKYTSASSRSAPTDAAVARGGKQCVCEVALWLQWELQGYLVAATTCEVASLSAKKFGAIASRKPSILCTFREYAGICCKWLEGHGSSSVIELGPEPKAVRAIVQETMGLVGLASITSDSIERNKARTVPGLASTNLASAIRSFSGPRSNL